MALDATVAGASANAYLAVAAADAHAADDMGPEASKWLAATTTEAVREQALKRATSDIDAYVRAAWTPYSATQALTFPRETDVDSLGVPFIPAPILRATYLQAAYVLKNAATIDAASARHARAMPSFAEEGISGSESDEPGVNLISPRAMLALTAFPRAGVRSRGMTVISGTTGLEEWAE